jgi:hypothetical protein
MLSVICATDGQTRGPPSSRLSAVATTSTSTTSMYSTRVVLLRSKNKRGEQQFQRTAKSSLLVLQRGHAERHLCNGWTNEGTALPSLVRRGHHVHKHHEYVLDACRGAQTAEQAWRAAVRTDSQELVTRSSAAMLSDICATDGQTRGPPSSRLSAVATTSTSATSTYSTRVTALRPRNKRGDQQFERTAKRSLLVGRRPC